MENSNGQSYTQKVGASIKNTIGSMKKVSSPSIVIMQTGPSKIKILRYSQDQMKRIIKDCEKIDGLTIEY